MILRLDVRPVASAIMAIIVAFAGFVLSPEVAMAQGSSAQDLLTAGLKAQKAGKHAAAIRYFSTAINSGALPRKRMTYALYRRAVSNRAQGQSAQAISDLNSALFFKGDLSSRDRADAIEERMRAFQDTGLKPTAVATASRAAQWSPSTTPSARAQAPASRVVSAAPRRVLEPIVATKPPRTTASLPPGTPILAPAKPEREAADRARISPFQTRTAAAPATAQAASTSSAVSYLSPSVERGVGVSKARASQSTQQSVKPVSPWQMTTQTASAKVAAPAKPAAAPAPAKSWTVSTASSPRPAPAQAKPTASATGSAPAGSSASQGFGQFFASVFGGATASTPQKAPAAGPVQKEKVAANKPDTTAATASRTATTAPPAKAKPEPKATRVALAQAASPAPAETPRRRAGGKYEIEVAQLRSKYRAEALAKQLEVQYSSSYFWSTKQKARVAELSAANEEGEGALYSVRYGVYASKQALSSMCKKFKSDGLDCEPVQQK